MTAIAAGIGHNGGPKLWLPKFEPWRLLRPLKMFSGQFYPGQPIQFMDGLLTPIIGSGKNPNMTYVVNTLGLTSGLKLNLDAGDGNSLPAASTKWLDTSGAGYDFFRGTTAGAEASDPTINGTADACTSAEYLSFDGGDYCVYDTTQETWMDALHKAGAVWSFCTWFKPLVSPTINSPILGTNNTGTTGGTGINITGNATGNFAYRVRNGGAQVNGPPGQAMTGGAWNFGFGSLNAPGGVNNGLIGINGASALFDATYTSPSAATASSKMCLGAAGIGASLVLENGFQVATIAMWQGAALSATDFAAIFAATRGRFGI